MLRWLDVKFSEAGPTGLKGYFPLRELIAELAQYGLDPKAIKREIEYLAKSRCIVTEDFRVEGISEEDLVRLAPAGFVHLELLGNANYWGAIAEDTWFANDLIAKRVAQRMGDVLHHYDSETVLYNARDVIGYLEEQREQEQRASGAILDKSRFAEFTDLSLARESISKLQRSLTVGAWSEVFDKFPVGLVTTGTIVNAEAFGLFVEVHPGITGLLHVSKLPRSFRNDDKFGIGEEISVSILSADPPKRRMSLGYVKQ